MVTGGSSWSVAFANTDKETVIWWHEFVGGRTKIGVEPSLSGKTLFQSRVTSEKLGSRLIKLGCCTRKSWADLHIPDMPVECLPHFLRGFNDGDGCISLVRHRGMLGGFGIQISLTSNSKTFRDDLCLIFRGMGWNPQVHKIAVHLGGSDAERFCQWVYGCGGQAMGYKRSRWEEWQELRRPFGGLICETDSHASQKGIHPRPWHDLLGQLTNKEISQVAGVTQSQVKHARSRLKGNPDLAVLF